MSKTMCKRKKEEVLIIQQKKAKYKCKSCGETANKEKYLCKPKKI
jgi:transposase-like protein